MKNKTIMTPDEVSRRTFLGAAAGAGAMLALAPQEAAAQTRVRGFERRTFFFNFSHESYSGHEYHQLLGKHRHKLRELERGDNALSRARRTNKFLSGVPDASITHVLENVMVPASEVVLSYGLKDTSTGTGEWQMSSVYLVPPMSSYAYAYSRARSGSNLFEPLRLSAKRKKYALPAAMTFQDLLEEQALLDTTDWATALVNLHAEMVSADPNSAAHIQTNHIQHLSQTFQLSEVLGIAGAATPQVTQGQDNPNGWATLVPYTDDNGMPLVNQKGKNAGLILYDAQWQPALKTPHVSSAMQTAMRTVKDDTTLGADVTNQLVGKATTTIVTGVPVGTLWTRNDGRTSVDQSLSARRRGSADNAQYTLKNITPDFAGYNCTVTTTMSGNDTVVTLKFSNWYVRYLGLYIQFLNSVAVVPASDLPPDILPDGITATANNELLLGSLTPEFTIYGIPVLASGNSVTFTFPSSLASSAKILASGLGVGSHTAADTEVLGIVMTSLFNLIIPAGLMALGIGTDIDMFVKTLAFPLALLVAKELAVAVPDGNSAQIAAIFWKAVVKGAIGPVLKMFLTKFIKFLAGAELIESLEDAIPIAGEIIQAIGVIGTVAEIAETTIETLSSPWTYEYDLVGTYDLTVAISPDPKDKGGFPAAAATYTVSAIFDGGTPHTQTLQFPGTGTKVLMATFTGVPLGGNVTLTTAFYTQDGTNVGHGTLGPVLNVPSTKAITITEVLLPINASTVYQHKQITTLDAAGNHLWQCGPAPAVPATPSACGTAPGQICEYRDITYNPTTGDVGYAWKSYSTTACNPNSSGQLDQLASIPESNSGANAQAGYASVPCSIAGSATLVYDPLGRPDLNFYVDTTNNLNILRKITFMPTVFSDPRGNQAWGKFTLPPDDLLLHPSGTVISINQGLSRMESLQVPQSAVPDGQAAVSALANLHGGFGTRPGLFSLPTVGTVTADGVVLILEAGNNRIHAVDASGNPVRHFTGQATPYFLSFTDTGGPNTQYLDIAVEFSGLIYVLSYNSSVYRLDIYKPNQTGGSPLSTTMGFNAAKVTVDYWRNVYSLNYQALMINGSLPPNGVTEPSISQWLPTTPPRCEVVPVRGRPKAPGAPGSPTASNRPLRRRDLWTKLLPTNGTA